MVVSSALFFSKFRQRYCSTLAGTLNQFPNPPIKIKFECFLPQVTSKLNTALTGAWIGNCELFAAADVDRLHVEKWIPN